MLWHLNLLIYLNYRFQKSLKQLLSERPLPIPFYCFYSRYSNVSATESQQPAPVYTLFRATIEIKLGEISEFVLVGNLSAAKDNHMRKMKFSLRDVDNNTIFKRNYTVGVGKTKFYGWIANIPILNDIVYKIPAETFPLEGF